MFGIQELQEFLGEVRHAELFEDAAARTLTAMLAVSAAALAASPWAARARLARGMVHLRPSDGYRQLVVLEAGGAGAAPPSSMTRLPSTTAWRLIAKHGCAAAIDVNAGHIEAIGAGAAGLATTGFDDDGGRSETRQRLIQRGTTHVYVLPLRGIRGTIEGMIALEAECRAAIGQPFLWAACAAELQALADIATPYLTALPLRPVVASQDDEPDPLLPVQGVAMKGLVRLLRVFAQQDETILLCGATGTGKSRLARWCHEQSPYHGGPFEILDLSTVPEELQLAELFGWRRGAFTGATRDHDGAIERAGRGTLFIDEIDKLSLRAQSGLLAMFETRGYRALGDSGGPRRAHARFVVGTNANLPAAVRAERFREDLFYRINVLPVRLPPLDERADEIPGWARYMLSRRHGERAADAAARLTPLAIDRLAAHRWPGNLRQLDNVIRRAYTMALAEHSGGGDLQVDEHHLARALAYEQADPDRSLVEQLHAAATNFVREAERRAAAGGRLDLELADAFQGLVLLAATEKLESRDDAFRLFGREAQVRSRNHHKILRRESVRVEALCRALGIEAGWPFGRVLEDLAQDD